MMLNSDFSSLDNGASKNSFSRNSLGTDAFQMKIGPASTPLINEMDSENEGHQDQNRHKLEIDRLIHLTQSLSSLFNEDDLQSHRATTTREHANNQQQAISILFTGITLFIFSSLLWIVGIPLVLFDFDRVIDRLEQNQTQQNTLLRTFLIMILSDNHYKYLVPLQLTSGLIFVIINWGGLKIFRHS